MECNSYRIQYKRNNGRKLYKQAVEAVDEQLLHRYGLTLIVLLQKVHDSLQNRLRNSQKFMQM